MAEGMGPPGPPSLAFKVCPGHQTPPGTPPGNTQPWLKWGWTPPPRPSMAPGPAARHTHLDPLGQVLSFKCGRAPPSYGWFSPPRPSTTPWFHPPCDLSGLSGPLWQHPTRRHTRHPPRVFTHCPCDSQCSPGLETCALGPCITLSTLAFTRAARGGRHCKRSASSHLPQHWHYQAPAPALAPRATTPSRSPSS